VRERSEVLAHPTAEAGSSPARSRSSPERWQELEGEADSGGPLSATPEWRGLARAVPTWAEREQAGQQAEFPGRS
jgi:hypothetical protein